MMLTFDDSPEGDGQQSTDQLSNGDVGLHCKKICATPGPLSAVCHTWHAPHIRSESA
jgi:hypothetical protein